MKIGIIGTGMIVHDLLTTINDLDIKLVAILATEATVDEGHKLSATYGIRHVFVDYDSLLQSDVDTIYIALPNHLHFSFAKQALERGKHVIIEKPIVPYKSELVELQQIAQAKNLIILEAMNIHYLPAFVLLKEKIKALGEIKIAQFNYSQYSSRYADFKNGIIHPAFDPKKYGGALMDLNIYNIHSIIGLFGSPKSSQYFANVEKGVDTSGILYLDYGQFKVSSIGAKDCKAPIMISIQGTEGNIVIESSMNILKTFTFNKNTGESELIDGNNNKHRLYYEFNAFSHIIDNLDYERAHAMLDISLKALDVIDSARVNNGGC
ncbi:putative dehydrogenase|uniref:Putative dehydrogenase n=1 Tax=Brenneria salicis ATCC 15712 = DSM 30166 TaxID=714314 RepID=A0A366I733_9GAMM|nr:Gfo/Idh/MocA family oxidoreductase [Brenneria salicis]NMN91910.1 putative dehydrogenase [Brenneria salicis ATCC 15712 = DSM 30166]RBP62870.1 putative dehydrogenase [Brenneria salicis ATCC 15712 = DSM 30166]RLM30736.1 NAD(P)-dependent oxidoreductase [Brenneria salicis ATCC 15712 = DSM 30166]